MLPTSTALAGGEYPIEIDPHDLDARSTILYDNARNHRHLDREFWFLACRVYAPTICVDVGMNYGECLLASGVPGNTRLYGFEANPLRRQCLETSLQRHPLREQINLFFQTVANHSGTSASSAIATITLDAALPTITPRDRLLFRIALQGGEADAARGMSRVLQQSRSSVGFLDFNPLAIAQQSSELDLFWHLLVQNFEIRFCDSIGHSRRLLATTWEDAVSEVDGRSGALLLLSNSSCRYQQRLLDAWSGNSSAAISAA